MQESQMKLFEMYEKKCDSCASSVSKVIKCHSCAGKVCRMCMDFGDGCCAACQVSYPTAPMTHHRVPFLVSEDPSAADCFLFMGSQITSNVGGRPLLQLKHADNSDDGKILEANVGAFTECRNVAWNRCDGWEDGGSCLAAKKNSQICGATTGTQRPLKDDITEKSIQFLQQPLKPRSKKMKGMKASGAPRLTIAAGRERDCEDSARTMMLCNIPCGLTDPQIIHAINSFGFEGTYEFVHVPHRYGQDDSNRGYAFVKFFTPTDAVAFAAVFEGYKFERPHSTKRCTVKVAQHQGYYARVENEGAQQQAL